MKEPGLLLLLLLLLLESSYWCSSSFEQEKRVRGLPGSPGLIMYGEELISTWTWIVLDLINQAGLWRSILIDASEGLFHLGYT